MLRSRTAAAGYVAAIAMVTIAAVTAFWILHPAPALAQASMFGPRGAPQATGLTRWILEQQADFYRSLSLTIRRAKTDGSALWSLVAISFSYGIFHAAGPGHGKAVISSYLVANRETLLRGVTLSFASALLQAFTAILVVGIGAVLLGATGKAMADTVRIIEIGSYSLIVPLGARLIWVKGIGFLNTCRAIYTSPQGAILKVAHGACGCGHSHRTPLACHDDDHAPGAVQHVKHSHNLDVLPWGHAHGPEPQQLAGPGGWRRGLSAIVGVGLRPCSGAILVLVFALSQGLFYAGVVSTFVMGFGTAVTVAVSAALAVSASTMIGRLASKRDGYGVLIMRGMEVAAAFVIFAFGALLLTGYLVSERLAGF